VCRKFRKSHDEALHGLYCSFVIDRIMNGARGSLVG
jgi:hypothetical protein